MEPKAALTVEEFQSLAQEQQGLYAEQDGIYVFKLAPATIKVGDTSRSYALEDVAGLKGTLNKVNGSNRDLSKKLKVYENEDGSYLDPQQAREAMAKIQELADNPPEDVKKQFEARVEAFRAQLETKHKNELTARDQELESRNQRLAQRESQLKQLLIDNAATAAIAAAKGSVDLLLPHVKNRCRCIESEDGSFYNLEILDANGETMYAATSGSVKKASMADLVEEFKNSNTFAVAFEGSNARGSGAASGAPAGSKAFTLTREQAKNPQAYRQMKERAAQTGQQLTIID